jgi:hypothetical protein
MECVQPYYLRQHVVDASGEFVTRRFPVRCGKCPACKDAAAGDWATRLRAEWKQSTSAFFITLTYRPTHIALTRTNRHTLYKKDVTDFLKKLRNLYRAAGDSYNVKYFFCGEYGGLTHRPHYHFIFFNVSEFAVRYCWDYGHVHIGNVTDSSIAYTTKYMCKYSDEDGKVDRTDDRVREFRCMSKHLGKGYLSEKMVSWHRADIYERVYVPLAGGVRARLPRYYRERLYTVDERDKMRELGISRAIAKEAAAKQELGERRYFHERRQRWRVVWEIGRKKQKVRQVELIE